jgi:hypothetical protein
VILQIISSINFLLKKKLKCTPNTPRIMHVFHVFVRVYILCPILTYVYYFQSKSTPRGASSQSKSTPKAASSHSKSTPKAASSQSVSSPKATGSQSEPAPQGATGQSESTLENTGRRHASLDTV